jgi:hypothetical protein
VAEVEDFQAVAESFHVGVGIDEPRDDDSAFGVDPACFGPDIAGYIVADG